MTLFLYFRKTIFKYFVPWQSIKLAGESQNHFEFFFSSSSCALSVFFKATKIIWVENAISEPHQIFSVNHNHHCMPYNGRPSKYVCASYFSFWLFEFEGFTFHFWGLFMLKFHPPPFQRYAVYKNRWGFHSHLAAQNVFFFFQKIAFSANLKYSNKIGIKKADILCM